MNPLLDCWKWSRQSSSSLRKISKSFWNRISSFGSYLTGFSTVFFVGMVIWTLLRGRRVDANYWHVPPQCMTLEWTVSSPPPFHQFEIQPLVK